MIKRHATVCVRIFYYFETTILVDFFFRRKHGSINDSNNEWRLREQTILAEFWSPVLRHEATIVSLKALIGRARPTKSRKWSAAPTRARSHTRVSDAGELAHVRHLSAKRKQHKNTKQTKHVLDEQDLVAQAQKWFLVSCLPWAATREGSKWTHFSHLDVSLPCRVGFVWSHLLCFVI